MDKRKNIALMATLYANHDADLYSDIYFPIIKYGIASICKDQFDFEKYYDIDFLQETIILQFGIKIPLVVLKQALGALVHNQADIVLALFDKGSKFQIKKKWDVSINDSVDEKLTLVVNDFDKLELRFKEYQNRVNVSSDKTFLDFFSDNTEDIFKYLDHLDAVPTINENYVHIANFLKEIKTSNTDLFNLANNIFWASVISAFLKRNVDLNIKPAKRVSYYLDSSLVMAILDLDSEINFMYGKELLDIIHASGNIACIHPLTIKEIDSILFSVERSQSAKPGSAIENAYYRRGLNPLEILKIRSNLNSFLDKLGIIIENVPLKEIDDIINKYKNKAIVNKLRTSRSYSYNNDSIRDLHDIFMSDFIKHKRGDVQEKEKINSYFVSLNSDLIVFINNESEHRHSSIIHPSYIITDLWMHDPKCSLVKKNGLTEIMSRCLALNNTDVRRKLRQLSQYIDTTSLSESDYIAIYHSLMNRSQYVLKKLSAIEPENVEESKSLVAEIITTSRQEEILRQEGLMKIQQQNDEIIKQNSDLKAEIENFRKAIDLNKIQESVLINDKQNKEGIIHDLKQEKNEILKLTSRLNEVNIQIFNLEDKRINSVIMLKYWLLLFLEIIAFAFVILFIVLLAVNTDFFKKDFRIFFTNETGIMSSIGLMFSIIVFLIKMKDLYILSPIIKYSTVKREQLKHWEDINSIYGDLKNERKLLEENLNSYK
jgi:hypothetical protein